VIGQPRLQFAVFSLARTLGISAGLVRDAVRRLHELGTLRVLKRDKTGHLVEMCLPEKIRAIREAGKETAGAGESAAIAKLENADFWKTWALRKAIHDRERGACFYCLRGTAANVRCLDHVVPRSRLGSNSYRNWCPAVLNAIRGRGTCRRRIFCGACTERGGLRPRRSTGNCKR
jgi:hypothetical protein